MNRARAVPVLMYHHVSPNPGLVTVAPETFREQMRYLSHAGYHSVGCDQLAAFMVGEPLPERSVMISFDDGYLDNYVYAHPVLQEFGFKAVLFLITGWLGNGPVRSCVQQGVKVGSGNTAIPPTPAHRLCMEKVKAGQADEVMLRWSEVELMRQAGSFEFHSHTHTHTRWDKAIVDPIVRGTSLADDLACSREMLSKNIGSNSSHLCWPQGYYDSSYQNVALQSGFTYLYTVEKGTCTPSTDRSAIPRVVVKDRVGGWFARRMWLYRHPRLTRAYLRLRGD